MIKQKRKFSKIMLCVLLTAVFAVSTQIMALAAWNTVPTKPYPTLDEVEIISGDSPNLEMYLKFSNNVGCIDETMDGRYDMTGYNDANLTKFHLADADGEPVDILVTPHPDAAMHTDESKYFYIYAEGLDTCMDYVLTVDEDLYANMGNSLGASYEVAFNLLSGELTFGPTSELPTYEIVQALTLSSSSLANNSAGVELKPEITLSFSNNISGSEVFTYNEALITLMIGTDSVPIDIAAGEDVRDIVVTPVSELLPATEYKLVVDKNLMAQSGSTLSSPINLYFTTRAEDDTDSSGAGTSGGTSSGGGLPSGTVSGGSDSGAQEEGENEEQVPADIYFSDVESSWAVEDINSLADRGAVTGDPEGTFRPDSQITRAEIVAVLVRALNLNSEETADFGDISDHWSKGYVSIAAACGIVNGVTEDVFDPDSMVTREQFAVMIVRAGNLSMPEDEQPDMFSDSESISLWAQNEVNIARANGIINGYEDGSFRPQDCITRAEACHMIMNLLNLSV